MTPHLRKFHRLIQILDDIRLPGDVELECRYDLEDRITVWLPGGKREATLGLIDGVCINIWIGETEGNPYYEGIMPVDVESTDDEVKGIVFSLIQNHLRP